MSVFALQRRKDNIVKYNKLYYNYRATGCSGIITRCSRMIKVAQTSIMTGQHDFDKSCSISLSTIFFCPAFNICLGLYTKDFPFLGEFGICLRYLILEANSSSKLSVASRASRTWSQVVARWYWLYVLCAFFQLHRFSFFIESCSFVHETSPL